MKISRRLGMKIMTNNKSRTSEFGPTASLGVGENMEEAGGGMQIGSAVPVGVVARMQIASQALSSPPECFVLSMFPLVLCSLISVNALLSFFMHTLSLASSFSQIEEFQKEDDWAEKQGWAATDAAILCCGWWLVIPPVIILSKVHLFPFPAIFCYICVTCGTDLNLSVTHLFPPNAYFEVGNKGTFSFSWVDESKL